MPSISSAGVGSGLDVNGLVSQLVAAERAPAANRIASAQSSIRLQLSAFGQFRNAMSGIDNALQKLTDADSLDARSVTVEDESIFTATAATGASLGSFAVEVEQLAQSHRLSSTTPVSPANANVGYGTLDLTLGSTSFSVDIDAGAQSLKDVRDAINNASDNPGVRATILNTDAGAVLQLTSELTGSDSEIQLVASGGDGGLNTLVGDLGVAQGFQDAIAYVNGYQVTSSSNTISDVIEGVTISLHKAQPGDEFQLTTSRDQAAAGGAMQAFVNAYNSFVDQSAALNSYSAATGRSGTLNGDSILRSASNQLRVALTANYGDNAAALSSFGLQLDVQGHLSLDTAKLNAATEADFSGFRDFLQGDNGFVTSVKSLTTRYIEDDGVIDGRLDSLNGRMERLVSSSDALDLRIDKIQARYLKQFSGLDIMLAQLQQTSSYLSQQLANLPGVIGSNKS